MPRPNGYVKKQNTITFVYPNRIRIKILDEFQKNKFMDNCIFTGSFEGYKIAKFQFDEIGINHKKFIENIKNKFFEIFVIFSSEDESGDAETHVTTIPVTHHYGGANSIPKKDDAVKHRGIRPMPTKSIDVTEPDIGRTSSNMEVILSKAVNEIQKLTDIVKRQEQKTIEREKMIKCIQEEIVQQNKTSKIFLIIGIIASSVGGFLLGKFL